MHNNKFIATDPWVHFANGQCMIQNMISQAICSQVPSTFSIGQREGLGALPGNSSWSHLATSSSQANLSHSRFEKSIEREAKNEDQDTISRLADNNIISELQKSCSNKRKTNPPPETLELEEASINRKKVFTNQASYVSTMRQNDKSEPKRPRKIWTREEDTKVMELINKFGTNWSKVSFEIGGTRTGKQIRDRYLNNLDPKINTTRWTHEEDQKLLELYMTEGNKWCLISKSLTGRNEIGVKNRFYSRFKHLLHQDPVNKNNKRHMLFKEDNHPDSREALAEQKEETHTSGASIVKKEEESVMSLKKEDCPEQNSEPVQAMTQQESTTVKIEEERTNPTDQTNLIQQRQQPPNLASQPVSSSSIDEKISDEDLLKIETEIASLEESLVQCRSTLDLTKSLQKNIQMKRNSTANTAPNEDLQKLNALKAKLPALGFYFKTSIEDLDRMLIYLSNHLLE